MSQIKILSWNISSDSISISSSNGWNIIKNHHAILGNIIIEECDIICLQECNEQFIELMEHKYSRITLLSKSRSHYQFTATYINNNLLEYYKGIYYNNEGVIIIKLLINHKIIYIVNCHLFPGSNAQSSRQLQLSRALQSIKKDMNKKNYYYVIVGDMNIREYETNDILSKYNVSDYYNPIDKYTWNSYINIYNRDTKPYKCRFDRIFVKNDESDNISVNDIKLIGNESIKNKKHYLSDHFGLCFIINF